MRSVDENIVLGPFRSYRAVGGRALYREMVVILLAAAYFVLDNGFRPGKSERADSD